MITLSDLQRKEVVFVATGEKLGVIHDVEIDEQTGYIIEIVVVGRQMKGSFFQKPEETLIRWEQIVTIGADIILIDEGSNRQIETKDEENTDGTDEDL